ncbi:MBL fold metallo-hydrolase [Shouchella shacheensis]|uniref:MBL fold metallo-hydrolase n=1 Tax=Shouchella shacheensis TaxID=1649580 RepID=UPI0007404A3D|nr:MBL fold metallo-hydrolase [Shouchella shacheensis]
MLLEKNLEKNTVSDVHMANGSVRFQSVHLNVYSFVTDGIVIDAGAVSLKKLFLDFWQEQPVDALYCTHIHEDHTGCADWFHQQLNVPVYLNETSIKEALKDGRYPLYRKLFWGTRKAFQPSPLPERFQSRHSDWVSLFTPGHSADHTAFLNQTTGQLFSGDLYVQTKTKVIMESESIPEIIDSLEHLLTYNFTEVFCSHAGYLPNGRQHLHDKLDYLRQIDTDVWHFHQQGLTVNEIQQRLFPRKYPIITLSNGQWDSQHIITSILKK